MQKKRSTWIFRLVFCSPATEVPLLKHILNVKLKIYFGQWSIPSGAHEVHDWGHEQYTLGRMIATFFFFFLLEEWSTFTPDICIYILGLAKMINRLFFFGFFNRTRPKHWKCYVRSYMKWKGLDFIRVDQNSDQSRYERLAVSQTCVPIHFSFSWYNWISENQMSRLGVVTGLNAFAHTIFHRAVWPITGLESHIIL